jgi:hypothetical protein
MNSLLHRFRDIIKGCIKGFDRIVFKGMIRPISYSGGMQSLLENQGVLNKNYKEWVAAQSKAIEEAANKYSKEQCGCDITYIPSCHERKEELAHNQQKKLGIESGLVGVWSCLESCSTFRSVYDKTAGHPQLKHERSRCKHLYFYYDHADYGFMSIRLQTWAPYGIQIALNGREWLRRSLDKKGCKYIVSGNKFLHIDDYELAQEILDSQIDTRWEEMLTGFLPFVFSTMKQTLGDKLSYYWTLWQSEWAKDYIFESPQVLTPLMDDFLRHALITGTCDRVLKYMGRPVTASGQPHPLSNPELITRVNLWHDGMRFRHWVNKNSIKCYNEQNVLRFEMTMNDPTQYRIRRHTEGNKESESKKLLPMRKGVADIPIRTKVSDDRINSFTEHIATVVEKTPIGQLLSTVTKPFTEQGRRIRALEVMGKDLELLQAISDPIFNVSFITNKGLQEKLHSLEWAKKMSGKQLSSRISRNLRLLREHGLIRKLPNQRKYSLTEKGKKLTSALNVIIAASTEKLLELSA